MEFLLQIPVLPFSHRACLLEPLTLLVPVWPYIKLCGADSVTHSQPQLLTYANFPVTLRATYAIEYNISVELIVSARGAVADVYFLFCSRTFTALFKFQISTGPKLERFCSMAHIDCNCEEECSCFCSLATAPIEHVHKWFYTCF